LTVALGGWGAAAAGAEGEPAAPLPAAVGAAVGVVDAAVLGAVDAPPPPQAASAIDASMTSETRRLGVVVTR
jgi:hypothetical protein